MSTEDDRARTPPRGTLVAEIGREAWDEEQAAGASITLEETIELAQSLAGAT